ncbi:uncharacterized protein BDW70DRAFT_158312 [Aspergillus foveolatus]|uniref:uncharacterized protein n=1 Tax=Aspergillus foveolatus TaxID=210207 RepID=UPI003CCE39E2
MTVSANPYVANYLAIRHGLSNQPPAQSRLSVWASWAVYGVIPGKGWHRCNRLRETGRTVFEKLEGPLKSPRAMAYFPVVLEDFKKAGIFEDVLKAGYVNTTGVAWRKPGGEILARISGHPDHPAVQIGQDEVADIILFHLKRYSNATDSDGVRLCLDVAGTTVTHSALFVVGADGGKSTVRHLIDVPLEGLTWNDYDIVAANIDYDIEDKEGWLSANFVVDPRYWAVVARVGQGSVWRVASGEPVDPTASDRDRQWDEKKGIRQLRERLRHILPGAIEKAAVLSISPYLLAGDAAHLTNPTGGLGLTTGFLDAAALGRVLIQIINEQRPVSLLEKYATERRDVFLQYTDRIATQNRKRLLSTEPADVQERERFFERINTGDISFLMERAKEELCISTTRDLA